MEELPRDLKPVQPRSEDVRDTRGKANLLIVAPVVLILLPLLFFEPFRLVEARLFDLFSTIFALRPPEPGVVIIAIDEPAFAEIGQRWPWPRALHARLTRSLREAGAAAIGFDIIFAEPATEAADRDFAAALGRDVVLAADEAETTMDHATQTTRVGPVEALTETGAASGLTSVDLDGDGYLRRLPGMADGFAAEALRIAGAPARRAPEGALIQYFGPPRSYPTYSYYQALDPARFLPPGSLKDRIVFVGLSLKAAARPDSGAPDTFLTPYTLASGQATAGVEVQATVLDNLRHGLFILPVPRFGAIGFAIAAALLAALLGRKISWASGGLSLLAPVVLIAGSWALLRFGRLWAPPVLPAAAFLSVFGTRLALDFVGERRLRRRVSEAFARYISPELVAQLARNPASLRLGGERRNLTVLFCDVRGFTSLSERLKDWPERLTALVNRLLDPLSGAILAEAGTIDKYIGDCVMAFWNAPLPCPDHPARAVAAAFRMIEAVEALNRELASEAAGKGEQQPRFAVGIGINSGDCVVGNVGSRWRYDYSALGDTVNLASRLEGLSKEYGVSIVLGPDTAAAVAGHFALIELDRIAVRGRASQSAIFTVIAPKDRADPQILALLEAHARLLDAMSECSPETAAILSRCETLAEKQAPELCDYYRRLRSRTATRDFEKSDPTRTQ